MLTLNDGRSELWQWDTGRTLAVDADCSQVHFSNKVFGRSIDVNVVDGVAIIPDILLQTDKDLNVWAFVGTAENGYTKISKTFKVNRRNKPADYVFTPVEQTTIAEIAAIAQSVRDDADAGRFDGAQGPAGPAGPVGPKGEQGDKGDPGPAGSDGKSAYDYAVEAGYTGTEAAFAERMAADIPTVDSTLTKSGQAADAKATGDAISSLSGKIVTTSESKVAAHNTGTDTHSDIRLLIQGLTDRLNALADSDDTTLDQLSEVVAYIKSNRSLIEAITTNKVSVADIIDNLTTNVSNKPLSAAQGVALKALIDAITIPTALPNPNALTFTGAVTGTYDGSAPLELTIPSGGGSASSGGGLSKLAEVELAEAASSIVLNFEEVDDIIISAQFKGGLESPTDTVIKLLPNYNGAGAGFNHNISVNLSNAGIGYYLGYLYSFSLKMRGVLYGQKNVNVAGNSTALRHDSTIYDHPDKLFSIRIFTDSGTPFGVGTTVTVYGGKL